MRGGITSESCSSSGKCKAPGWEVSLMIKTDLVTGLLLGVILGLYFTTQLSPHLAFIVILAVLFGTKMIHSK